MNEIIRPLADQLNRIERTLLVIKSVTDQLDRIERAILNNKRVLNFEELCTYTGFAKAYVYQLTSQKQIPFSKPLGNKIFFDKNEIDNWLLKGNVKPTEEL